MVLGFFSFNKNVGSGFVRKKLRHLLQVDDDESSATLLRSG